VRRHDLDLVSLITGAVFALVAGAHLVSAATGDSLDPLWLAPALLIGLGVAGLAGALRSGRPDNHTHDRSDDRTDDQPNEPASVEDATTSG
jgi:hypothetical protein